MFNDTVKMQHQHIFDNIQLTVLGNNVCSDCTHSGSRGLYTKYSHFPFQKYSKYFGITVVF